MIDPLEAHRQEIWEGLMEAGARGEVEKFRCFNIEWERLNALYPEGEQVVFGGDPVPYTHRDYCGHCHSNWQISGIRFGAFLPGSVLRAHMEVDCPARHECCCWSEEERPEGEVGNHPECQECHHPLPWCSCPAGITLGPCAQVEMREWLHGPPPYDDDESVTPED